MLKLSVHYCRKTSGELWVNGGSLLLTDENIILKSMWGKAVFSYQNIHYEEIPQEKLLFLEAVRIYNSEFDYIIKIPKISYERFKKKLAEKS